MRKLNADEDFFEDGLYYLKKSIQLLSESSRKQHEQLSSCGLLEELYYEIISSETFFYNNFSSDYAHSLFLLVKNTLKKICDGFLERKSYVLLLEDFENHSWQELRHQSRKLLYCLEFPNAIPLP